MAITPLNSPIAGEYWSYDLQFFGPTAQCHVANDTEQATFDNITAMFETQDSVFTFPQVGDTYWDDSLAERSLVRLIYWGLGPDLPANTPGYWVPYCSDSEALCDWQSMSGLWLQTSTSSIVCIQ
jgi:hypothetical protein